MLGFLTAYLGWLWLKNIFLSQYLFIAILCVKMSRVNWALERENESENGREIKERVRREKKKEW